MDGGSGEGMACSAGFGGASSPTVSSSSRVRGVNVSRCASDLHWGSFFTQVPVTEFQSGMALENMSHEPLGFLSGSFKGSQLRWATVDKEGCLLYTSDAADE